MRRQPPSTSSPAPAARRRTPAGAGALTRNFMRQFGLIEPGHVYARMIQSGQHVWPYDKEEGAGDLKMPTCGTAFWGKVNINGTGSTVDIPLSVGAGRTGIESVAVVARARRRELTTTSTCT